MLRWLMLLMVFFYVGAMHAQPDRQYYFKHIDQRDGLLHNSVFYIAQDPRGFVWISSKNGLQRYDGVRFKNYQQEFGGFVNPEIINNIYPDDQKNIWLIIRGVAKYNTATNEAKFFNEEELLTNPQFHFEEYKDGKNNRWWISFYGMFYQPPNESKPKMLIAALPGQNSKNGNVINFDSVENCYWATVEAGILKFDKTTHRVYSSSDNPTNDELLRLFPTKGVACYFLGRDRNIWLATWDGNIYQYNRDTKLLRSFSLQEIYQHEKNRKLEYGTATVTCFYQDTRGTVWAGTDHAGLLKFDPKKDGFRIVESNDPVELTAQFNYTFFCINEDREGNLWLGTDKGISIFHPYHQPFQTIGFSESQKNALPKEEITSVYQAKSGDVYVTTWGRGISLFDSHFQFKKTIAPKGSYEYPLTWDIVEDNQNRMWIGAQHGYIHLYNQVTGSTETIHPPEMGNATIRCMDKDEAGNIWFGLHNGKLVKWNAATKQFQTSIENKEVLNTSAVITLLPVAGDKVLVSRYFGDGVLLFDQKQRKYTQVLAPGNVQTKGGFVSRALQKLNDSTVIVGTQGRGVWFLNTKTNAFFTEPSLEKLRNKNIVSIYYDNKESVWMCSDYVLYYYHLTTKKLIEYTVPDGMIRSAFESLRFQPLQDGRLATSTLTEAFVFEPRQLTAPKHLLIKPTITSFQVGQKDVYLDSFLYKQEPVSLSANENFITVRFSPLLFNQQSTEDFFYRLNGVDKDWVKSSGDDEAVYTNLAPGHYVFTVRYGGADERNQTSSISFQIVPPFYATWWFRALAAALVFGLLYLIISRRVRNIRQAASLKQQIAEAELKALRAQMNPHFIFNCLNAIDNMIQTNQKEKATTYLHRFAKLIRGVLDSTKNNLVPLHKDVETLKLYLELEKFRCDDKFLYELKVDPELLNGDYKVPPLLVQPFIENAIHHGLLNKETGDRKLSIEINLISDDIHYIIKDNGVGRQVATKLKEFNRPEHQSYGIQISTSRVLLHNKSTTEKSVQITDLYEKEKPAGTQIDILIKSDQN